MDEEKTKATKISKEKAFEIAEILNDLPYQVALGALASAIIMVLSALRNEDDPELIEVADHFIESFLKSIKAGNVGGLNEK